MERHKLLIELKEIEKNLNDPHKIEQLKRLKKDLENGKEVDQKQIERLKEYAQKKTKSKLRENIESILVAVLLALFIRSFIFEPFKIPSGSMIPTLLIGDRIFVDKFSYGIRIPLTYIKFFGKTPAWGDIIVFIHPIEKRDYVKRVVGLPGDKLEMDGEVLIVNGNRAKLTPYGDFSFYDYNRYDKRWYPEHAMLYQESLFGRSHPIIVLTGRQGRDGPYFVRENHVFVMGDNRDNSQDSRFGWQVPLDHIIGKVRFVWFSYGGEEGFRWKRLFSRVR